jgi:putative radical SAM enzyme (TIGR03279 family)
MTYSNPLPGVKIENIQVSSIAAEIGLEAGDRLLALNGQNVEDGLDFRFRISTAGNPIFLQIQKVTGEIWDLDIEKDEDEELGLELEDIQTRICKNNCIFCFVHQLPRGKHIRKTLRVKDEDFRLSFLHGNYLTLTNLSESDFQRITDQHLSPLYISVHATEPDLRQYLLQSRQPDFLLDHLARLVNGGILLHTQIVLMPEVNDGLHLERSIFDLLSMYPGIQTVAVVPVGLTDHRQGLIKLKPVDASYARETIHVVHNLQKQIKKQHGTPFCFLGDEFYIKAGYKIPGAQHYGGFPIIENGVGMVRRFLDEFRTAIRRRWPKPQGRISGTVATGEIFFPILKECLDELNQLFGTQLKCLKVENHFLGKGITVAGLLSGSDIYSAVENQALGDFLIIPSECMIGAEGLFLDDWVKKDLEERLHLPVYGGGYHVADFLELVFSGQTSKRG